MPSCKLYSLWVDMIFRNGQETLGTEAAHNMNEEKLEK
jgi:hypothetical protein